MKLLKLFTLFATFSSICTEICPPESPFCMDIKIIDDEVKFTFRGPLDAGYMSIGIGTSMKDSEMYTAYVNSSNEPKVIQSLGVGHTQPKLIMNGYDVSKNDSQILSDKKVISFTRSLKSSIQKGGKDLKSGLNNFIWAYSPQVPTDDGIMKKHNVFGSFNYELNAQGNGALTIIPNRPKSPPNLMIIHGGLMLVSWVLLPILAIYVARFLKGVLGKWWFRLHFGLFILSGIISLISIILLAVYRGNLLDHPHSLIGVIVMILFATQVTLGIYIDRMWDSERDMIPTKDKVHWWLGRFTFTLAIANTIYGIAIIRNPISLWIPFIIILGGSIVVITITIFKKRSFRVRSVEKGEY